jgi:cytoskeletal protein CcmA (bactofilin family)
MFKNRDKSATQIDTLIGRSASINGDVEFSGGLHVEGRVTGSVRAAGAASLSIGEHAVIEGSVEAPQVVLNGTVKGDIVATDKVVLGARARVHGNVSYGVIEMALGAEINGRLIPSNPTAGEDQVKAD